MISRETLSVGNSLVGLLRRNDRFRQNDSKRAEPAQVFSTANMGFRPMATCLGDQVSAKQVQMAKSLAKKAHVDENELAWSMYECEFGELSKQAAERIIDSLSDAADAVTSRVHIRLAG